MAEPVKKPRRVWILEKNVLLEHIANNNTNGAVKQFLRQCDATVATPEFFVEIFTKICEKNNKEMAVGLLKLLAIFETKTVNMFTLDFPVIAYQNKATDVLEIFKTPQVAQAFTEYVYYEKILQKDFALVRREFMPLLLNLLEKELLNEEKSVTTIFPIFRYFCDLEETQEIVTIMQKINFRELPGWHPLRLQIIQYLSQPQNCYVVKELIKTGILTNIDVYTLAGPDKWTKFVKDRMPVIHNASKDVATDTAEGAEDSAEDSAEDADVAEDETNDITDGDSTVHKYIVEELTKSTEKIDVGKRRDILKRIAQIQQTQLQSLNEEQKNEYMENAARARTRRLLLEEDFEDVND